MRVLIDNENEKTVLSKTDLILALKPESLYGEVIAKTATNFWYVTEGTRVGELADQLINRPEVNVLAVTDHEKMVLGIIIRQDFFNLLGQKFGRDIYLNRDVIEIAESIVPVYYKHNIFSVVEKLSGKINRHKTRYFILTDEYNRFRGCFSTKDILLYLSDITQKDILLAKNIQSSIVKTEFYEKSGTLEIVGAAKMAKGVGGDFYTIEKNEKIWTAAICDVSGKGVSASLISVIIGGMFEIYNFKDGIKNFIKKLNSYVLKSFNREKFLTGIFMKINEENGKVKLYDMGHSYCYIYRENRLFKVKTPQTNLPLGITDEIEPVKTEFQLFKNDILLLISDGLEEQQNVNNKEYGISNILKHIKSSYYMPLNEIRQAIYDDIEKYRKGQPQGDDMTLVMFRYF